MEVSSDKADPLLSVFSQVDALPFTLATLFGIIIILILLAASALVSGSEVAFFSLGPKEKSELGQKKTKKHSKAAALLTRPDHLLATILVANNLVNVGIVVLSTWLINSTLDFTASPIIGFIVQTIVITFVILLIGEILPKVYATRFPLRFVSFMAYPVAMAEKLLRPLTVVLVRSTSIVRKRLKESNSPISMDDLSQALELTGDETMEDEQILKGIVRFGNIDVVEIMRPRVDMIAIDLNAPFGQVIDLVVDSGYSRIPVYVSDPDHIKGILVVKDLLPHFHKPVSFRWQSLVRPPYFVPESKKINDLLAEFKLNKNHLAIVVDEYGGTSGLVTLEDILEEIVGEISDESDEDEIPYSRIHDYSYLFSGKTTLHDFKKLLELPDFFFDDIKGDSETLAGLMLEIKGEMPQIGETIVYDQYTFIIRSADERRIKEIQVDVPQISPGETL